MASSFNAVPEPQSTGDYAVMSCRLNPGIYMHADTSSLIFHSTGWTACLHLKKKKSLDTAVRQDNNRIMHGPGFTTFDYLTLSFLKKIISFCSLLSISLLHLQFPFLSSCLFFFKRPHLSLPPSVSFLFSPLVLSSSSLHLTGFVSGEIVWGVSFWQLIEGLLGRGVLFFPCPLVSCLLCRVTGVTRSRHSLWKLVFDVAVSLKRTSTTASSVRSAFKLHTVNRQPFLLLSQHHITLCQQCKTSRFSACNMARIRFAVTIYWKAISTFSFNFFRVDEEGFRSTTERAHLQKRKVTLC